MLVVLIDGGAQPSQFVTQIYTTEERCKAAAVKRTNYTTYGYCTYIPSNETKTAKNELATN